MPPPAEPPPLPASVAAGDTTVVALSPSSKCCPRQTLWEFLGVKGLLKGIGGLGRGILNRLGSRFPGLEPKPPMLAITDPANLESPDPSMAAAAEAKAEEDKAAQKVKAIRYLATLGCSGCYPGVEDALLEKLKDCTEEVRYEVVKALRGLSGEPCKTCKSNACCSPKVLAALDKVANETDDQGCNTEPSARVRRLARLAIAGCGGAVAETVLPTEGPTDEAADAAAEEVARANAVSPPDTTAVLANVDATNTAAGESNDKPATQLAANTQVIGHEGAPSSGPSTRLESVAPQSPKAVAGHGVSENWQKPDNVLARVNGEVVLESEIVPKIDRHLSLVAAEMPIAAKQDLRRTLVRRELDRAIDRELVRQDGERRHGVGSRTTTGQGGAVRNAVYIDENVPATEIQSFYRANIGRFRSPVQVRWELLQARTDRFRTRNDALKAVEYLRDKSLGNRGAFHVPRDIDKTEAETIGWTNPGEMPNVLIAAALQTLPVGELSAALEDKNGVYLVRVLERRAPRTASFAEATGEIRRQIVDQRRQRFEHQLVNRLRRQSVIWTVFDEPVSRGRLIPAQTSDPAGSR